MYTIDTEHLAAALSSGRTLALVDVLPEAKHAEGHIPSSINVPLATEDFTARVTAQLPHKVLPVIVYGSDRASDAPTEAAARLENAGFRAVYQYPGGVEAWQKAGHPLSRAKPVRGS